MNCWRVASVLAVAVPVGAGSAVAQGYRLRLDTRLQTLSFRGAEADSIPASDVVTEPDGSLLSPDGYAVRCSGAWCYFWRQGPEVAAAPWVTSADFSVWGLGIEGLSLRGSARGATDLADGDFAGTEPSLQLLEGYAEYARGDVTVAAGRQILTGRLGYLGFDGARGSYRVNSVGLEVGGFAGWSLARGSNVPWTSPSANPLGEFRPAERLVAAGAWGAWRSQPVDVRVEYQREVDPQVKKLTAERLAFAGAFRLVPQLGLSGGAEYNIAEGVWGSADASLRYTERSVDVTVGASRYRPFFPLWTVWAAFSPVAWHSGWGTVQVTPWKKLRLRARGEAYAYQDAEAQTPLTTGEDDGWRFSWGGTYLATGELTLDADFHTELGPGAASNGWSASAGWHPHDRIGLNAYISNLSRPLEYRFNNAEAWWYGADATWDPMPDLRLGVGLTRYDEDRDRPDAGALDWSQTRLTLRASWFVDSGADRWHLPPAVRSTPSSQP